MTRPCPPADRSRRRRAGSPTRGAVTPVRPAPRAASVTTGGTLAGTPAGCPPRPVGGDPAVAATAVADEGVLPLSDELDLAVGRPQAVQRAVPQGGAARGDDGLLEVADPLHRLLRPGAGVRVQGVLLGLDPAALAAAVPAGVALRDVVAPAGRLRGGEQVVGALGAQPDGEREPLVEVFDVWLAAWTGAMAVIWWTIASGRAAA